MPLPMKDQPGTIGPFEPTKTKAVFAWPPKAPEPGTPRIAEPIPIHLPNPMIESIETHLLGRTGLAFDRWARQTGWVRDTTKDYCWRCGGSVGEHEPDGAGCATCRAKPLPWDRAIRLGRYAGTLRAEILALKFTCWRSTGHGLGMHLGQAIRDQLELAQIPPNQAALVPVPMHRFRRVSRGIDHTLVLARAASKSCACPMVPLLKARLRPEQVGLSMSARARNVKGAFYLPRRAHRRLANAHNAGPTSPRVYILVDDVRTTGATFVAASRALKSALTGQKGVKSGDCEAPELWVACLGVAGESRRASAKAQR